MMKILIVGSKGFIGNYAYAYFSGAQGYECWACDVVVDYVDDRYFLMDSANSDFNEIFETIAFDVCINCSGAASVPDSLKHPLRDFTLNTLNVIKILEAIRRHAPHCRFINMSSAAVYGNPQSLPIPETSCCLPVSPYGRHKLFAEELCREYNEYFCIQTCSLRIFSAYGPGLKKQLFWDIFQKSLCSNEIILFGTGNETRDFIFVQDIINAIELILKSGKFMATVYNVANGIEITIKEAAYELLQALGYEGKIIFSGNERAGDPLYWKADIDRLNSLGYQSKFSMKDGLVKYVQWIKEEKLH